MDFIEKFGVGIVIVMFLIAIVSIFGYVGNIVKLCGCDWEISAEEVVRSIGVFVPPLGIVLGFIPSWEVVNELGPTNQR